jgi:hypothetical protein
MTRVTSLGTVAFQEIFADGRIAMVRRLPELDHYQWVHSKPGGGAEWYDTTLALPPSL